MGNCIVCGAPTPPGRATCCQLHYEVFVAFMEERFGEFKKVVRMTTGVAYKVPTRDIISPGIKERELDRYPLWPDGELDEGVVITKENGKDGIQAGKFFIPFLQDTDELDAIVARPVSWGPGLPGAIKATCKECGQEVWISLSTQVDVLPRFPDIPIYCMPCMARKVENDDGVQDR